MRLAAFASARMMGDSSLILVTEELPTTRPQRPDTVQAANELTLLERAIISGDGGALWPPLNP